MTSRKSNHPKFRKSAYHKIFAILPSLLSDFVGWSCYSGNWQVPAFEKRESHKRTSDGINEERETARTKVQLSVSSTTLRIASRWSGLRFRNRTPMPI